LYDPVNLSLSLKLDDPCSPQMPGVRQFGALQRSGTAIRAQFFCTYYTVTDAARGLDLRAELA
jgi:hypothetical protein